MPSELVPAADTGLPISVPENPANRRRFLEDTIEKLISELDKMDPDPDIEDENEHGEIYHGGTIDDEPSLGATHAVDQARAWSNVGDDLEFDADTRPSADAEPSLGSPIDYSGTRSQAHWARGASDDREEECEDEGADIQAQPHDEEAPEPSLGSVAAAPEESQEGWSQGDSFALDHEPDNRNVSDIEKAKARVPRTPSGIYSDVRAVGRAAVRDLERLRRGEKRQPRKKDEPFKPYKYAGVWVIGEVN